MKQIPMQNLSLLLGGWANPEGWKEVGLIKYYSKMRLITFIIFIVVFSVDVYSREKIEKVIEPALIEIRYERRKVLDTLDYVNDFRKNILTLKVGKSVSAFYSAELKTTDSIEFRHPELVAARMKNKEAFASKANLPREKVFKYFYENKIIVHDRFDISNWLIEEELSRPIWEVSDSTQNILGFECIFAVTEYRGRKWEVWFTPEIPISDGPWKLNGLPGLILKAQDSKRHYIYEPLSVRTEGIGNIEYYDYDAGNRLKITREEALPRKYKSLHEDLHFKIVSSGAFGIYNPNVKERKTIPHTNYDFEETDYPH